MLIQPSQLSELGGDLRAFHKTSVWTCGIFDLCHIGHIRLLKTAKEMGHKLFVGVNSDSSTAALKPGRPIIPDHFRAELINSLAFVDYVVVFNTTTAVGCLELLRPDVFVKGEDARGRHSRECEFVASYGGRIEYVPIIEGVSTTSIIQRIKELPDETVERACQNPGNR